MVHVAHRREIVPVEGAVGDQLALRALGLLGRRADEFDLPREIGEGPVEGHGRQHADAAAERMPAPVPNVGQRVVFAHQGRAGPTVIRSVSPERIRVIHVVPFDGVAVPFEEFGHEPAGFPFPATDLGMRGQVLRDRERVVAQRRDGIQQLRVYGAHDIDVLCCWLK